MPSHLDDRLRREVDHLLTEIDLDYSRQKAAQTETFGLPYGSLARLLAIALPEVSEDFGAFLAAVHEFAEELPKCVAQLVLHKLTDPRHGSLPVYLGSSGRLAGKPSAAPRSM
jgi:hypothetical protein